MFVSVLLFVSHSNLLLLSPLVDFSIQYTRLLHDKVKAIDERTAPKKEIDHSAEAAAAAVAMGGGMLGLGGNLMIGDVGGYGG